MGERCDQSFNFNSSTYILEFSMNVVISSINRKYWLLVTDFICQIYFCHIFSKTKLLVWIFITYLIFLERSGNLKRQKIRIFGLYEGINGILGNFMFWEYQIIFSFVFLSFAGPVCLGPWNYMALSFHYNLQCNLERKERRRKNQQCYLFLFAVTGRKQITNSSFFVPKRRYFLS